MPETGEVFRDWRERFIQDFGASLTKTQRMAIADICACRTPAMEAGNLYSCPKCGSTHFGWRSCGNRNCPKCGNEKVTAWLEARRRDLLPVDYFMMTFTLPSELRALCRRYPGKGYAAFFKAASDAIKDLALDKRFLGGKAGMLGTLQTWRRDGEFHPHIHFLVPGGGISVDGDYWLFPKCREMLLAPVPLAKLFKGKFTKSYTLRFPTSDDYVLELGYGDYLSYSPWTDSKIPYELPMSKEFLPFNYTMHLRNAEKQTGKKNSEFKDEPGISIIVLP